MTDGNTPTLRGLQELDLELERIREAIASFEPRLEEVEAPARALEEEITTLRGRLQEMRVEERRLERSADEKRARMRKLQERLNTVRNLREEAAVQAELDLLRRALEGDEQEALTLLDQIRRTEERLEAQEAELAEARAEVEPRREDLLRERKEAEEQLGVLEDRRKNYALRLPREELRLYERIRAGGRSIAVTSLTPDGACGHCFSVVPLQLQQEVRQGRDVIRCEACGVILTPEDS